jgi:hypothetical protein
MEVVTMTTSQPTYKFDLDRDIRTVEAMAERLTPYVYENELYGLMPGDLPRLTIGGLLMRLHRLASISGLLSAQQQTTLANAKQHLDNVRKEWAVAYEGKVSQELKARLRALDQFANECGENPRGCVDNYPSSIEKRVIVEALEDEATASNTLTPDLRVAITNIDEKLRRYVKTGGNFIWDQRLEPAYPRDKYPFLYTNLSS